MSETYSPKARASAPFAVSTRLKRFPADNDLSPETSTRRVAFHVRFSSTDARAPSQTQRPPSNRAIKALKRSSPALRAVRRLPYKAERRCQERRIVEQKLELVPTVSPNGSRGSDRIEHIVRNGGHRQHLGQGRPIDGQSSQGRGAVLVEMKIGQARGKARALDE